MFGSPSGRVAEFAPPDGSDAPDRIARGRQMIRGSATRFPIPLADWQVGGVAWVLLWAAHLPPVVRGIPGIPHRPQGGFAAFPCPTSET